MQHLFGLDGRPALVTGGNGGLGLAMARGLQLAGALVAVTGRNPNKNAAARALLGEAALVVEADVADEETVERAAEKVASAFGGLDILVNNAGAFRGGSVTQLSLSDWRAVVDSHLSGAFLCTKNAVPHLAVADGGKVINIGSMYSCFGDPDFADYTAAKTGLLGLTRALAVELAPQHIQVNAILPGWYETDLTRGMPHSAHGAQIRAKTPAGRWGDLDDLIGPVVFLASAASDFVTGASLPVHGRYLIADRERRKA
jgi:2-deoxy-D-gluconate 3-dehydrogenase